MNHGIHPSSGDIIGAVTLVMTGTKIMKIQENSDDDDGVVGGCSNLWSSVGPPWGEEGSTPPPSHPSLTGDNDHNDRAHDEDDSIDDYDGDGHWQKIRKGCILRKRV